VVVKRAIVRSERRTIKPAYYGEVIVGDKNEENDIIARMRMIVWSTLLIIVAVNVHGCYPEVDDHASDKIIEVSLSADWHHPSAVSKVLTVSSLHSAHRDDRDTSTVPRCRFCHFHLQGQNLSKLI
jgi:hypothetical protein